MTTRDKFLREQKILRITTINSNGVPHIVPVWYLYSVKKFYIGTNSRTIKIQNLEKNNNVAFCIDVGINAPNIYGVMGQGKAKIIKEKNKVTSIATKILLRYFKSMRNKSAQSLLEDTDRIIEINPDKITKWKY